MSKIQEVYARLINHRISDYRTVFTVPVNEDMTNTEYRWSTTDLHNGEIGVNYSDNKAYLRTGNQIKHIDTSYQTYRSFTQSGTYSVFNFNCSNLKTLGLEVYAMSGGVTTSYVSKLTEYFNVSGTSSISITPIISATAAPSPGTSDSNFEKSYGSNGTTMRFEINGATLSVAVIIDNYESDWSVNCKFNAI